MADEVCSSDDNGPPHTIKDILSTSHLQVWGVMADVVCSSDDNGPLTRSKTICLPLTYKSEVSWLMRAVVQMTMVPLTRLKTLQVTVSISLHDKV